MSAEILSPIGSLPDGWKLEKLVNITTKIGSGSTPRGGDSAYLSERVEFAFVRSQNVFDFHFNESEIKYISNDDSKKLKGVHLQKNDILLNITGDGVTFGRSCIVPEKILPAAVNQHVTIIRVNPELCLSGYLLAYLCLPVVKEYISSFNAGGSRRAITKAHIESFDIPIAPRHIQLYIEKITFDYLNKINLNTQTNKTLESIAQAIFKSWFVDFEPVKAKMAVLAEGGTREQAELAAMCVISGKSEVELAQLQQQNPEHYKQLAETAVLFSSAMVDSELGEIPEGWGVQNYSNLCKKIESGGTPKRNEDSYWNGEVSWLSSGEVRDKVVINTKEKITIEGLKNSSAKLWPINTTVIAMYGATAGEACLLAKEMSANQACCGLIPKTEFTSFVYLSAIRSSQLLAEKASGSAQQNLNKGIIENHNLIAPPSNLAKKFESTVQNMILKLIENYRENISLSELRDSLLPKLLSGEIDLSDIQSEVA